MQTMSAQPTPSPADATGIGRPNVLHGQPVVAYSRFVTMMKVLLPVMALMLMCLTVWHIYGVVALFGMEIICNAPLEPMLV